jgi:UDP-glucose 4-epimerase
MEKRDADEGDKVLPTGYGDYSVFNLGTGTGYSVLEMVEGMKVSQAVPQHHQP